MTNPLNESEARSRSFAVPKMGEPRPFAAGSSTPPAGGFALPIAGSAPPAAGPLGVPPGTSAARPSLPSGSAPPVTPAVGPELPAAGSAPSTASGGPPVYANPSGAKPPFRVRPVEVGAALGSYLLAWCYVKTFFEFSDTGLFGLGWDTGLLVFVLLFWFMAEWFCRLMGRPKAPAESRFWLFCLFAIALGRCLWHSRSTGGWDVFLLHAAAAYWVVCRAGALADGRTGPLLPLDLGRTFFALPFGGFFLRIRTLWQGLRGKKWGRQAGVLLTTLVVVCPALLYAARQLAGADDLFAGQLRSILHWAEGLFGWQGFGIVLLSLPVGCYLYGLAAGALRKGAPRQAAGRLRDAVQGWRVAPALAVGAGMGAFCALYSLFFVLQARYLFGAFTGVLPQGFTASQYAVQGFWELCRVVLLNFGVLAVAARFSRSPLRSRPVLKFLALALMVSSGLFVAVAASKMALYVGRFGLTCSRLLASWFMVVLAVWVALAIGTLCRPFGAVRWGVLAAAGLFALLCLAKPDGIIVRTNFALYQAGVTRELDVSTLRWCGAANDLGSFVRRLQRAGWFEGRTADELRQALGAPDETETLEDGERCVWELGMNLIDPEWLVVTLARDGEGMLRVYTAQIVQG